MAAGANRSTPVIKNISASPDRRANCSQEYNVRVNTLFAIPPAPGHLQMREIFLLFAQQPGEVKSHRPESNWKQALHSSLAIDPRPPAEGASKKIKKSIASNNQFDRLPAPRRPQGLEDSMFADR